MDALKFIEERQRMCKSYYDAEKGHCSDECPAHDVQCTDLDNLSTDAEELITRVEAWSAAHPRKTRQSVFLEQWPDALTLYDDGFPQTNPCELDAITYNFGDCTRKRCAECRREFWMQEVE